MKFWLNVWDCLLSENDEESGLVRLGILIPQHTGSRRCSILLVCLPISRIYSNLGEASRDYLSRQKRFDISTSFAKIPDALYPIRSASTLPRATRTLS